MRFRFESHATDGLDVLREIPSITPCLIEGRNGIGKTVAVRLLELIAGQQPYEDASRQWHSLRQRLGATVVRVDQMQGAHELEFTFTPEAWSEAPEVPGTLDDWLGRVRINGEPAAVSDAQALLWVARFAGNEDLDDTLRRRTRYYASAAHRTGRAVSSAVERMAELLEPLRAELESVDPQDVLNTREQLSTAEEAERRARKDFAELLSRHERFLRAIEARDRLVAAENPDNALHEHRRELTGRLAALAKEQQELEGRIKATSEELKRQGDVEATLGDAQRSLRYRLKRRRNIQAEIDRLAAQLGIDAEHAAVSEKDEDIRRALAVLRERQREIDVGGATVRLIDSVSGLLEDSGSPQRLDEETLVVLSDRELTVAEVRNGMSDRREQLRNEPKPEEFERLTHESTQAQRQLAQLKDLATNLTQAEKQDDLVATASEEVEQAEKAAERAGHRDEQYREDNRRLGALEEETDHVTKQLAEIHSQFGLEGGESPEDARSSLERTLSELGVPSGQDIGEMERDMRSQLGEAQNAVNRTADHAAVLRRNVTVMSASVDAAISAISVDERFSWLRDELPENVKGNLDEFASLRAGVVGLLDDLEETRNIVQAVGEFAETALEPQPMIKNVELYDAVRAVLASELRDSLDTPQIRKWLFSGARVESINLAEQEVVLAHNGTTSSPRAFDTFSTGEQAFAFTQARILELEPSRRPNRLLVLDEFGAFVAADRMPDLAEFLSSQPVKAIADQILVILPLQVDYEAELPNTTGALRARYDARTKQIGKHGYYTELLTT